MPVSSTKKILVSLILLFFSDPLLAQQNKQMLREVLQAVEKQYTVSFTFRDEDVDGRLIESPATNLSLTEVLGFLQQQTNLVFTKLDERFITIHNISRKDRNMVCGRLIDDETKEAIAGATIQQGDEMVVSNNEGYFELQDGISDIVIRIKSLGYKEMIFTTSELTSLPSSPCKIISLQLKTSSLSEVVILNYLAKGISKVVDGSLVIQTKELGILPGLTEPDVLFTVQALPGIQSVDETVSNINVRGGTNDQNLVLWDGMKMYQTGHFFGLISAFNPYLTKEVNIIKNGTTTMLNDAVSSTIDIRSDDHVNTTLSGGAGLNMIYGDLLLKIPLSKRIALHVSGRRSIADIVKTPTYQSYFSRAFRGTEVTNSDTNNTDSISTGEDFKFYDVSAKFLYDITDKDKLRISFLKINNRINYEENAYVDTVLNSKTSGLTQENVVGGISYSHMWNKKIRTSAQVYFSCYNLEAINYDIPNAQRLIQQNEVEDTGLKLDTRFQITKQFDLFAGYQFYEVGITNLEDINNPTFYRLIKKVLRTHVAFAESNYTSSSGNTNIRAGVRANFFTTFNAIRIEPRVSFNQRMGDHFSLEVLGELKSQTTMQVIDFQNDFLGVEKRRWVLANNKDIPFVKSKQASIAINFHNDNLLLVLEGYTKYVDGIVTSSQGFQNQFENVRSIGKYASNGLEFLAKGNINKLTSWTSYSLSMSHYTFNDLVPPGFPSNLDIRHRITWGASYQMTHWDFSAGVNWHTGKPYTQPLTASSTTDGNIQYQSPNSSRLSSYWRVDISMRFAFQLSKKLRATTGISIWNVLNHYNVIDAYYQINTDGNIDSLQRSALGFTPNIMFRVAF